MSIALVFAILLHKQFIISAIFGVKLIKLSNFAI